VGVGIGLGIGGASDVSLVWLALSEAVGVAADEHPHNDAAMSREAKQRHTAKLRQGAMRRSATLRLFDAARRGLLRGRSSESGAA
jgi:hypothetical protein